MLLSVGWKQVKGNNMLISKKNGNLLCALMFLAFAVLFLGTAVKELLDGGGKTTQLFLLGGGFAGLALFGWVSYRKL